MKYLLYNSKCVEVVVWDISGKTGSSEEITSNLKSLISDIQKRENDYKPNIIVTPTSATIASESI